MRNKCSQNLTLVPSLFFYSFEVCICHWEDYLFLRLNLSEFKLPEEILKLQMLLECHFESLSLETSPHEYKLLVQKGILRNNIETLFV